MMTNVERHVADVYKKEISFKKRKIIWKLLHRLKEHHFQTYTEVLNVGLKTREIAIFMHISPGIALSSGCLHDIGKIGISKELLDKTYGKGGDYTPEDHEVMKPHTETGYNILIKHDLIISAWVALTHHIWKKNQPYPENLPPYPKQIKSEGQRLKALIYSRIVSLADQYVALHRPNYMHGKKPLGSKQIQKVLEENNPDQAYLISQLYQAGIFK